MCVVIGLCVIGGCNYGDVEMSKRVFIHVSSAFDLEAVTNELLNTEYTKLYR
jgi:hypothetical protein